MITTTESVTEKERKYYGVGYRASATRISDKPQTRRVDDSVFIAEDEEVERRISAPEANAEVMPTVRAKKQAVEQPKEEMTQLTLKSKMMLGLYVCVAAVLAIIVAATGIIIGNRSDSVQRLENEVKTLASIVSAQDVQIENLTDEEQIQIKAELSGMVAGANATQIELIELGEESSSVAHTNFFDSICDWLSQIVGG